MEALEVSGMPFSYFPVMMPHASGDHVIAPTPVTMENTSISDAVILSYVAVAAVPGVGTKGNRLFFLIVRAGLGLPQTFSWTLLLYTFP